MKDIEEDEPDQWNVSADWLRDSEKFHEWMVVFFKRMNLII